MGMSPQVQEAAPSMSASLGSAETLCDDDVPPIPMDTHKDCELAIFTQGKMRQAMSHSQDK